MRTIRRALSIGIELSALVLTMAVLLACLSVATLAHAIRNEWGYLYRNLSNTGRTTPDPGNPDAPAHRRNRRLPCLIP
jgi:hypothetical protein